MSVGSHRILIVEDEVPMLRVLSDTLKKAGFTMFEASNGEEGLHKALKEHPDLILLDIVMPKMDGLTVLKKLREDTWGKNAGVILLTNLSASHTIAQAIDEGADEYLVKSNWNLDQVVEKIKAKFQ